MPKPTTFQTLLKNNNIRAALTALKDDKHGRELSKEKDENGLLALHHAVSRSILINSRFDGTMRLLEQLVRRLIELYPESAEQKDMEGYLPLHLAILHDMENDGPLLICRNDGSMILVEILMEAYPDGAKVTTNDGYLPIHLAVRSSHMPFRIVERLAKIYPGGLQVKDRSSRLPIHSAATTWGNDCIASFTTIKFLVDAFPGGLQEKDSDGNLPIHCALLDYESIYDKRYETINPTVDLFMKVFPQGAAVVGSKGRFPLHSAARAGFPINTFEMMVEAFPRALEIPDEEGYLPIHHAISTQQQEGSQRAMFLLEKRPATAAIPIPESGHLPIHLSCVTGTSRLPILQELVKYHPAGIQQQDKNGNLPIHLAIHWGYIDHDALEFLILQYPKGLEVKNKFGNLPIHLTLCEEMLTKLAKICPQSLLVRDHSRRRHRETPVYQYMANRNFAKFRCQHVESWFLSLGDETKKLEQEIEKLKTETTKSTNTSDEWSKNNAEKKKLQEDNARLRTELKEKLETANREQKAAMVRLQNDTAELQKENADLKRLLSTEKKKALEIQKVEETFRAQLLNAPENEVSIQTLKAFACSLKSRIDLMKERIPRRPTNEWSIVQTLFDLSIDNPSVPQDAMAKLVQQLAAELSSLEKTVQDSNEVDCSTENETQRIRVTATTAEASDEPDRVAKRSRVSLP